ncbi:MAG: hypothetical protein QM757_23265 [Paludibaculum sp.]
MAIFISAGTLGMALSPAFFKEVIERVGFEHLIWAGIPGILLSILMLVLVKPPGETGPPQGSQLRLGSAASGPSANPDLILGVFFRSVVQVTYGQFLILDLSRQCDCRPRG